MKKRLPEPGFTLIELILVVAIVSTITIMSSAFYARFLLQNSVDNTTDQLVGSFRKAQMYSLTGRQGSSWGVAYQSNTITLYKGTTFAGRDIAFDETFSVNNNVTVSGTTEVNFSRVSGLPTPSAAGITVSGGGNSRSLSVNSQGVVSRN